MQKTGNVSLQSHTADTDELWRRIVERHLEGRWSSRSIQRHELDEWVRIYQPPTVDEERNRQPRCRLLATYNTERGAGSESGRSVVLRSLFGAHDMCGSRISPRKQIDRSGALVANHRDGANQRRVRSQSRLLFEWRWAAGRFVVSWTTLGAGYSSLAGWRRSPGGIRGGANRRSGVPGFSRCTSATSRSRH